MSIKTYLKQLKNIQENIVEYINNGDGTEVDSLNIAFLKDQKFDTNKYLLKETLYMLLSIANNHHHTKNFYNKIFTILNLLKESIKINLTNYDVFSICECGVSLADEWDSAIIISYFFFLFFCFFFSLF